MGFALESWPVINRTVKVVAPAASERLMERCSRVRCPVQVIAGQIDHARCRDRVEVAVRCIHCGLEGHARRERRAGCTVFALGVSGKGPIRGLSGSNRLTRNQEK